MFVFEFVVLVVIGDYLILVLMKVYLWYGVLLLFYGDCCFIDEEMSFDEFVVVWGVVGIGLFYDFMVLLFVNVGCFVKYGV